MDASSEAQADAGLAPPAGAPDAGILASPLTVTTQSANGLAAWVRYETTSPCPTDVAVVCGDEYDERFASDTRSVDHRVFVMGLLDGVDCSVRAYVNGVVVAHAEHQPRAPAGWPDFELTAMVPDTISPGWTLLNLSDRSTGTPAATGLAVLDARARLRWYVEVPAINPGQGVKAAVVEGGVLACGKTGAGGPIVVGWDGRAIWQPGLEDNHHDCNFVDAEEQVLRYLGYAQCSDGQREGAVREIDRATGEELYEWAICEHYTPADVVGGWSHLNAIASFSGGEAFLLSSRNQHALFKVDRTSGEILWKLGPGGDFGHAPADAFWNQHAPEIQPNGNILLMDNGAQSERAHSRAIEIAIDEDAMTYEVVWEWALDPPVLVEAMGDADRLANDNVLVTFGAGMLVEVTDPGHIVWQVELPPEWLVYRAERITPHYGRVDSGDSARHESSTAHPTAAQPRPRILDTAPVHGDKLDELDSFVSEHGGQGF